MPVIPTTTTLTASTIDILNVIRNNASTNFQTTVSAVAANDLQTLHDYGESVTNNADNNNEFITSLLNRIAAVLITSKMYTNPWTRFKRGMLEFGETVEEIFVNLAKPYNFDPATAESEVFKREIPDVRSTFHPMNYQKFYKTTISNDQLRQAFLSWSGITDLIARITESLYTSANYDEFLTMKYIIARAILSGRLSPIDILDINDANMKSIVSTIKATSNGMRFMSTDYNLAGVSTYSDASAQNIILSSAFDAKTDVEVLAAAFNMDKAEFMGRRVLVDSFGKLDVVRLTKLLGNSPDYVEPTVEEMTALDAIPAILVDSGFFMIFDNLNQFTEQYNPQGLYWNYFNHVWKTFSLSPFANAAMFLPGGQTVTSVTVTPSSVSVTTVGETVQFSAAVVGTNFPAQTVTWSVSSDTYVTISETGLLTYNSEPTVQQTVTVTATSTVDPTKTGTATVTIPVSA